MQKLCAIILCVFLPLQGYAGALMSQMHCAGGADMRTMINTDCCAPSSDASEPANLCDSGLVCQLVAAYLPEQLPAAYVSLPAAHVVDRALLSTSRLVTDVWRPPIID